MRLKISLILVLILLSAGCVSQSQQPEGPPSLEFDSGPCDQSVSPYDSSALGVKETVWTGPKELEVKAYVSINCAEKIDGGNFTVEGNVIVLTYSAPHCTICTTCNCAHLLTYRISNLPRITYQFSIERISGTLK